MFSPFTHIAHPRYGLALAGAAAALALASPVGAQEPIPPNNGGLTQYVAPAADPGGDRPANPAAPGRPGTLPPSVRAALPRGSEGELLERFATSPGYGAPDDRGSRRGGAGGGSGQNRAGTAVEDGGSAVSAVASAASDSGVALLVGALVAFTLGAAALGRSRRRS